MAVLYLPVLGGHEGVNIGAVLSKGLGFRI